MSYSSTILAETSLVSYWRLGAVSGILVDSKDSNPSTGVGAGLTYSASGLISSDTDKAVLLSGTSTDWAKIADAANLQIGGAGAALSIEFWTRPTTLTADYSTLVAKYAADNKAYDIYIRGSGGAKNGAVAFIVRGGAASTEFDTANGLIVTGSTYHIVATYDDTANSVFMYINGVQVFSNTSTTQALDTNTALLSFGGRSSDGIGDPVNLNYAGVLDEVAIYNAALRAAQVTAHYAAAAGVTSSAFQ